MILVYQKVNRKALHFQTSDDLRFVYDIVGSSKAGGRSPIARVSRAHYLALEVSCTYSRNAVVQSYYRGNVA